MKAVCSRATASLASTGLGAAMSGVPASLTWRLSSPGSLCSMLHLTAQLSWGGSRKRQGREHGLIDGPAGLSSARGVRQAAGRRLTQHMLRACVRVL